ncbi:WhiB family transcriptional regulator [Saccharopolyspora sp. NPDC002376]
MTASWLKTPPPGSWVLQAPCRREPALFDPIEDGRSKTQCDRIERAMQICLRDCPVREQCRAYAESTEQQGVWGGEYHAQVHDRGTKAA